MMKMYRFRVWYFPVVQDIGGVGIETPYMNYKKTQKQ